MTTLLRVLAIAYGVFGGAALILRCAMALRRVKQPAGSASSATGITIEVGMLLVGLVATHC